MAAETGLDAAWRTERRSWQGLLAKILTSGENVSPLLMVPFAAMRILMLDWLHCVDLGVAAEFIGQMVWYFIVKKKVPGGKQAERIRQMHLLLQNYYDRQPPGGPKDRLPFLGRGTIKGKKNKYACLKSNAGTIRHMVPWAMELAQQLCDQNDPIESALYFGMQSLDKCYAALSGAFPNAKEMLKQHSTACAEHFSSLERVRPRIFHTKPKLHQFLELCASGGDPAKHWNYRDEDFGGAVANFGRRRGGPQSTREFSRGCMTKFMGQPVVRLVR